MHDAMPFHPVLDVTAGMPFALVPNAPG
jgi:hypothetical protein